MGPRRRISGSSAPRLGEDVADDCPQTVVDVVRREDMVARLESLNQRGARRQAGGEGQRFSTAFERGQALLERAAVRVIFARVAEAGGIFAVGGALESCRQVNRRSDRAGGRVYMAA